MKSHGSSISGLSVGLTIAVLISTPATAEVWPLRPVTMVVPLAAGGTVDTVGRILAGGLSRKLGQPVVVENVGGAGGMNGANRVAKATPDGYQFLLASPGELAGSQALYETPLFNAQTDFVPVTLVSLHPFVLVTRKDFPAGDLREFMAYARAKQGAMQYGSAGVGSATHFACALLNAAIGINVTHVPYRGGGQAMQDLIAGRIDYQCPLNTAAIPQIEAHAIKVLAVLARERSPSLPEVPSAEEQGLKNSDASFATAVFLPKAVPTSIVQRLHESIVATLDDPAVQEQMARAGADLVPRDRRSPQELEAFLQEAAIKWSAVIKANGVSRE